jgi:Mrp family chromosome partitioning ATPase
MAASLIERAVGHPAWGGAAPARREPQAAPAPAAPSVRGAAPAEPTFQPVWRRLARHGFLTPATLGSPLALEIAAAKRRLLRQLDLFRPQAQARHTVLVTSAEPGEGKSFVALNLALSLALEEQLPVTLVDADLHSPSLARLLDLPPRRGLADRLMAPGLPLDGLLHRAEGLPLAVLDTGDRTASPARLFGAPPLAALLGELADRQGGGLVILDGPPVLATNEAPVLAQQVAQVVLVVSAGRTGEEAVGSALELLDAGDRVGLLLNRSRTAADPASYVRAYYGSER